MLMSVIESVRQAPAYPELAGKRVLVTGITSGFGVDIVRAFADHRTRLILQFAEESEQAGAIAEVAAPAALDVRAFGPVERSAEAAAQFARAAVRAFNGLDVVINLVPMSLSRLPGTAASTADVENMVAAHLLPAALTSRIAANRMGLVWRDGLVLNVAALTPPVPGRALALAALIKAALAHMTRVEAEAWAKHAVRCNAIAQQAARLDGRFAGEPEMAALALYLASDRGKGLSGHVFEAEPSWPAAPEAN
jgi:3-oxoacyl-[acyl-carrier protein] reductase